MRLGRDAFRILLLLAKIGLFGKGIKLSEQDRTNILKACDEVEEDGKFTVSIDLDLTADKLALIRAAVEDKLATWKEIGEILE